MRAHGCIDSAGGLGADAHACWAFDETHEFVDASLEYLSDGLRTGQRLAYVGSEPVAEQRERLAPLGDVGAMIDKGALQLFALSDLYEVGEPIDPQAQIAVYTAAGEGALADGYTGLRVAAQVTELGAEPHTREALVRWESLADRFFSTRPLSALCGYRRPALPEPLVADLAAIHPATNLPPEAVPFQLYSETGNLVLSGEVDLFSAEDLDRVLELTCHPGDRIELDLGELDFIDHHGLEVLAGHIRRLAADGECAVHNPPPVVERLRELLGLEL
ncbi:MAG TPA: MEDS domain-containing protein [Solirubrobacterales bacterium]|nr:MEDS domain-containing protein [Solirubrobacterales bacterium]